MATTKHFLFGRGLQQDVDDRVKDPEAPRAIENLIKTKDGRLAPRFDYDALPMTLGSNGGNFSNMQLHDIHNIGKALIGLGSSDRVAFTLTDKVIERWFEFVNEPQFGWARPIGGMLPVATEARNVGTPPFSPSDVRRVDVAAGGGLICNVWQFLSVIQFVAIHVINPSSGNTVLFETVSNATFPRVVCTGTIFFISGSLTTDNSVFLRRFNPATDNDATVALTNPDGASANVIRALDMSLSHEGTSFWLAYGRAGSTTRFHGFDVSGTQLSVTAGPAELVDAITIFTEARLSSVQRVHLARVINGTGNINLTTYTTGPVAIETNTAAFGGSTSLSQVGLSIVPFLTNGVLMAFQNAADIITHHYTTNTHAIITTITHGQQAINGKPLHVRSYVGLAVLLQDVTGVFTNGLYDVRKGNSFLRVLIPNIVTDRLIARQLDLFHLSNLAHDTSTQLVYWARCIETITDQGWPAVTECQWASTRRRQSTQAGNILYMAGGIVMALDGRSALEAGGFLQRPRIIGAGGSGGGSLTVSSTYQVAAVLRGFDAQQNIMQSAVSDVTEVTLSAIQNQINVTIAPGHGFWEGYDATVAAQGFILDVYRTERTNDGNATFYLDVSTVLFNGNGTVTIPLTQADVALEDNAVVYTQGARGILSGPLPFITPEPAISLAASSDRIITGGLPNSAFFQESRPHIESEQIQWSDSIGFRRDTRGEIRAVARLDERRIIFTDNELFEADGPGVDDNGNGEIGAPRRLPSDVGIFGGTLGWRSIVECSPGLLFQGQFDLIYLLPRGGVVPVPVGEACRDTLAVFPTIAAAVYVESDQTARFACNNAGNTNGMLLVYDVRYNEWYTEGPFGEPIKALAKLDGRLVMLRGNVAYQQRASHPPASFVTNAWRSGSIHPHGPGQAGRLYNVCFFGEYQSDAQLACTMRFDDNTTEALAPVIIGSTGAQTLVAGDPVTHKFTANQTKSESVRVDFDVTFPALQVVNDVAGLKFSSLASTFDVPFPTGLRRGDRLLVAIVAQAQVGNAFPVNAPTGFTMAAVDGTLFNNVTSFATTTSTVQVRVLDRRCRGDEVGSFRVTTTIDTTILVKQWVVRGAESSLSVAQSAGSNQTLSGTTLDPSAFVPAWGTSQATLLFSVIGLSATLEPGPNVTAFPAGTTGTGELLQQSASALISGAMAWATLTTTSASIDLTAYTWTTAADAIGVTFGLRAAIVGEGLRYHYFTIDSDAAGKSSLKGPTQMS